MSVDMLEQLAQYGADHRARQAPVERQEILARVRELTEPEDDQPLAEEPPARPRLLLAAAAVAIALIAGLALVVVGRDASDPSDVPGTDLIRSTEPSLPETDVEPTPSTSTTSTTTPAGESDEAVIEIPTIGATALEGEPIGVAGATFHDSTRQTTLGAWRDGFLHVSAAGGVQMVPELSDEMLSRFPIEVQEAYPEQLVGTLDEVRRRLEEDGLAEAVYAAMEADPELEAAVLGGPITPVELLAEFTVDGETWTPIEVVEPPGIAIEDVFFVGSRLVAVGTPPNTSATVPFKTVVVASTEDLADWSVQTVPDAVETLAELSIAANDDGWVAHIEPDHCELEADGALRCGLDPTYGYDVGEGPPLTWAAAWGAQPEAVEGAVAAEGTTVTALQHGFLAQHDQLEFSTDGLRWEPAVGAPPAVRMVAALRLGDGSSLVFGWTDSCEAATYRVDRDVRRWERIALDIEDAGTRLLPTDSQMLGSSVGTRSERMSAVLVTDSGQASGPVRAVGNIWVAEQDGLRLDLTYCAYGRYSAQKFELVDIDSGAIVVAEDRGGWSADEQFYGPFDHLIDDRAGVRVLDPATGEVLVTFDRNEIDGDEFGYGGPRELWLQTTSNGLDWLVDDLTDAPDLSIFIDAARNGDMVLVGSAEGWRRYELPA